MNIEEYKASLQQSEAPSQLDKPLQALWYAAKEDWQQAHKLIQDEEDSKSAWVHAYLHRQEGDTMNAQYWYTRASRSMPDETLNQEWENIVTNLLN